MSNDGKRYFHMKEYSILQLLYAGTLPAYYIKVSELNTAVPTPSDVNGITCT